MKKGLLSLLLCSVFLQGSMAQAPKWLDKTKKAIFSVITYDKDNNILSNGNGFFVTADGVALSDLSLFNGAQRAVIINSDGKQFPVSGILGANGMYDVIKFRVAVDNKGVTPLAVAANPSTVGEEVYLLPYSTQKERLFTAGKVKEIAKAGEGHSYYTLDMKLGDKQVSCPVVNSNGEVVGLAQKPFGEADNSICYAVGATLPMALEISALSLGDINLKNIGIKTAFPDSEEQALVFLFMASSQVAPKEYAELLDDFIAQFPQSIDGYIRRATNWVYTTQDASGIEKADADLKRALSVAANKDDAHYNAARLIYVAALQDMPSGKADWTLEKALSEVRLATTIQAMPVYKQLEGDILFAMKDYAGAFAAYEEVTRTNLVSSGAFFNAAKAKELMGGETQEVVALMDSCIAHCAKPIAEEEAGYLLERAQIYMDTEQYRAALQDYDEYYFAVNGAVNDLYYYYREQAALYSKQYQRALDDINKAIELAPDNAVYQLELGAINTRVGRYEEAEGALKKSIASEPTGDAYRLLGIVQVQLKQNAEACNSFTKAKELGDPMVDGLIEKHCK